MSNGDQSSLISLAVNCSEYSLTQREFSQFVDLIQDYEYTVENITTVIEQVIRDE
jgi:hypothetical protein